MRASDRYDSLIQYYAELYGLNWFLVKRQVEAESSFRPQAVSPAGAVGLMQTMPGTFSWAVQQMRSQGKIPVDYEVWIRNPEDSIHIGCWYMAYLTGLFGEIPDADERYRFALAAYNAGRNNINKCLSKAREASGAPSSYAAWDAAGRKPGPWQTWGFAKQFLHQVTGKNAAETIGYVEKILPEGWSQPIKVDSVLVHESGK